MRSKCLDKKLTYSIIIKYNTISIIGSIYTCIPMKIWMIEDQWVVIGTDNKCPKRCLRLIWIQSIKIRRIDQWYFKILLIKVIVAKRIINQTQDIIYLNILCLQIVCLIRVVNAFLINYLIIIVISYKNAAYKIRID